jgi:hypothetical protein
VVPGAPAGNTVFDDIPNFGLSFGDRPDLAQAGDFVTFQTELVGVTMTNNSGGTTTVTYSPLTSSIDSSLDDTTIFNWMWVQYLPGSNGCKSGATNCGNAYYVTSGDPDSSDPLGAAFFLGFGVMDEAQIDAAVQQTLASLSSYDWEFAESGGGSGASPVPEPSTWAMMLVGAGGLALAARRRRQALSSSV